MLVGELLKRKNDFIGQEFYFTERTYIWRGPVEDIYINQDGLLTILTEWAAASTDNGWDFLDVNVSAQCPRNRVDLMETPDRNVVIVMPNIGTGILYYGGET